MPLWAMCRDSNGLLACIMRYCGTIYTSLTCLYHINIRTRSDIIAVSREFLTREGRIGDCRLIIWKKRCFDLFPVNVWNRRQVFVFWLHCMHFDCTACSLPILNLVLSPCWLLNAFWSTTKFVLDNNVLA